MSFAMVFSASLTSVAAGSCQGEFDCVFGVGDTVSWKQGIICSATAGRLSMPTGIAE